MIEDGIGVAILPESAATELAGAVSVVPLTDVWARRRLALCLRDPDELTFHARLLLDHVKAIAKAT